MRPAVRVALYAGATWVLDLGRLLLWCVMTGCLAWGTTWSGRPAVLTDWLATGPPARGRSRTTPVAIKLQAGRGIAALECWLAAGKPPRGSARVGTGELIVIDR